MKGTRAALRYAKALLDLAKDRKIAGEINSDMLLISQTISENKDLEVLIESPIVKSKLKQKVLTQVFGFKCNALTIDLINLLIENNRINLLDQVAKQYQIIYDFLKGVEIAQVTTAIPLTKELEEKVLAKIKTITTNKITIENIVDPDMIGGFVLRVGDKQYDSSVKGILSNVLEKFEDNQYIVKL